MRDPQRARCDGPRTAPSRTDRTAQARVGPSCDSDAAELFQPLPAPASERFGRLVRFCERHEVQVLAALPHVVAELGHAVGFDALFRFLWAHNGNTITFPTNATVFSRRYGLPLDTKRYERLRQLCGGAAAIDIPSGGGVFTALRRVAVQQFLLQTGDPKEAARRFGVTRRYLRTLPSNAPRKKHENGTVPANKIRS